jgi:hypothetical protein
MQFANLKLQIEISIPLIEKTPLCIFPFKFNFDGLVKSQKPDGFVKTSPATGGTRRAKTEEGGP